MFFDTSDILDGRKLYVNSDHKPLTTAIKSTTEKSPRHSRHLSLISEFTSDIRHEYGKDNIPVDTLTRINGIHLKDINKEMIKYQKNDEEVSEYAKRHKYYITIIEDIICGTKREKPRQIVPKDHC